MKCFKQFILFAIIMILLVILISIRDNSEINNYEDAIEVKDDSIFTLLKINQELELMYSLSSDTICFIQKNIVTYQDSINILKRELYNSKKDYETKINDITNIPTDSLYRELTRWYNTK